MPFAVVLKYKPAFWCVGILNGGVMNDCIANLRLVDVQPTITEHERLGILDRLLAINPGHADRVARFKAHAMEAAFITK